MRKLYLRLIPVLLLLVAMTAGMIFKAPVRAAGSDGLLTDGADLFSDEEETGLLKKLEEVSDSRDCDVAVITTGDLAGKDAQNYVDDEIDSTGLGSDRERGTVVLLVFVDQNDESNREVRVATDQKANEFFSDEDNESIINDIIGDLSSGSYADAAMTYADSCDSVFGDSLDKKSGSRGVSPGWIFGDLGIGAVLALILGSFQKSKLKTARRKSSAADYKADGGINFSVNKDTFLKKRVERKKIEKDEKKESSHEAGTTHTTSSGTKHGGAGRKF